MDPITAGMNLVMALINLRTEIVKKLPAEVLAASEEAYERRLARWEKLLQLDHLDPK